MFKEVLLGFPAHLEWLLWGLGLLEVLVSACKRVPPAMLSTGTWHGPAELGKTGQAG